MNEEQERAKFRSRFSPDSQEVLVLTQELGGCGRAGKDLLWEMSFPVLGVIDLASGQLSTTPCRLCWQLTDAERKTPECIFDLHDLSIYHLRVHSCLPTSYVAEGGYLWVTEVLARDRQDARLEALLADYQTPVILEIEGCAPLTLDKRLDTFRGEGTWADQDCLMHLYADAEGAHTADHAATTLQSLLADSPMWDQKARRFAAQQLVDFANDWQEEEDVPEITADEFAQRISISEISIFAEDGEFELYYDDDDLFYGHVILISGSLTAGFSNATIAG